MTMFASSLRATLFPAGTLTGTSLPLDVSDYAYLTVYYTSSGTTSGGTILLEEADYDPTKGDPIYGGTWSQIESRSISSFTGSVTLAKHLVPSAYAYLRARITSDVTGGGTIKVVVRGHL